MPAERAIKLPAAISDEQAAGMMLKGMTARYLLRRTSTRSRRATTLLMHAAAGGVGTHHLPMGKSILGATVIGTAGSKEKPNSRRRMAATM